MKYKCECGKLFIFPAEKSVMVAPTFVMDNSTGGTGMYVKPSETTTVEHHECPYCQSLNFDEYTPPQPEITSIKSVAIEDADALIVQGYVVLEAFAKTVTLIKKKEEKP